MGVAGLSINTIVNIEYNSKDYKCTVQEITDDYIAISIPVDNGEYLVPHSKEDLTVTYYSSSDVYSFNSSVIGRKVDNIPLILISIPLKVKIIQRRNYVRVSVFVEANCWSIEDGNGDVIEKLIKSQKPTKGTILDISGGGSRLLIESKVKMNDLVCVEIPLDNDKLLVYGRVVRISNDDLGREIIGLDFKDMSESTRDRLIKFVFDVMRKQRRKV